MITNELLDTLSNAWIMVKYKLVYQAVEGVASWSCAMANFNLNWLACFHHSDAYNILLTYTTFVFIMEGKMSTTSLH